MLQRIDVRVAVLLLVPARRCCSCSAKCPCVHVVEAPNAAETCERTILRRHRRRRVTQSIRVQKAEATPLAAASSQAKKLPKLSNSVTRRTPISQNLDLALTISSPCAFCHQTIAHRRQCARASYALHLSSGQTLIHWTHTWSTGTQEHALQKTLRCWKQRSSPFAPVLLVCAASMK